MMNVDNEQVKKFENELSYLFQDGMTAEEKLKVLAEAWWTASNSGYSDAMANCLVAGEKNIQTQRWELNCKNKFAINCYYKYLMEMIENV